MYQSCNTVHPRPTLRDYVLGLIVVGTIYAVVAFCLYALGSCLWECL